MANVLPLDSMFRICLLTSVAMLLLGCQKAPTIEMFAPQNIPTDATKINPWIATLLDTDATTATGIVRDRLSTTDPRLLPIVESMSKFSACQVAFSTERGHVRCVREYVDVKTGQTLGDAVYLVEPLSSATIKKRIVYFDEPLRSTMSEFLLRFAGSGEEMLGNAGHFAYDEWPTAEDFGYAEESSLGTWKNATLFYHSLNGDAVFIKPDGSTAWRVLETDETIPLATTFDDFIKLYSQFLETHESFDSWNYRDFNTGRTKA